MSEQKYVKIATADPSAIGLFGLAMVTLVAFLGYLIFSIFMTIGAMETHKVLFIIFLLIDCLFIGLTLSTFGIMTKQAHDLAAYSEFCIAIMSFYGSAASVLNAHFGRMFLPVGKPFGIFKK